MTDNPKRFIFLGSSGRIGRLLKPVWPDASRIGLTVDWQYRTELTETKISTGTSSDTCTGLEAENRLIWPDLTDPAPLLEYASHADNLVGAFVFVGVTPNGQADASKVMSDNVDIVCAALDAAHKAQLTRLIVASSSAVYGAGSGVPFAEADTPAPVNAYGQSKLEMERRCEALARSLGIEICFLRIGNVAGADSLLGNFSERTDTLTLDIFPDGDGPRRSYIGPSTLAQVLTHLALTPAPLPKILNVGGALPVSMNALLDAAELDWKPRAVAASPQQDIVLECRQLKELFVHHDLAHSPEILIAEWRKAMNAA